MWRASLFVVVTSLLIPASYVSAAAPACGCEASASGATTGNCNCQSQAACQQSGCAKHGHQCCHCRKQKPDGLQRNFNCNCNGSFNYPVPPLYTYHWPGMFKQQRMTDYHSPWRFPALKPYADEQSFPHNSYTEEPPSFLRPVAYETATISENNAVVSESMSSKFEQLIR